MENKQYELDVYALVNSLMTKLGITYPIDYLLEWYNHTDKVQQVSLHNWDILAPLFLLFQA